MSQCLFKLLSVKIAIALFIVPLTAVSSFGLTSYANYLQTEILGLDIVPMSYQIYFKLSSVFAMFVPIIVFIFLYISINLMINYAFDERMSKKELYITLSFAFLPVLLYQYFFWYNLITYCNPSTIKTTEDFLNMRFIFNLGLKDLEFISNLCWMLLYLNIIIWLYLNGITLLKVLASVVVPTALVVIFYQIL